MTKVLYAERDAFGNVAVTVCGNPDGHSDTDCPGDMGPLVYGKSNEAKDVLDKDGNVLGAVVTKKESDEDHVKRALREALALAEHRAKELTPPTPIKLGGKNG
jgi:hypothetical protein